MRAMPTLLTVFLATAVLAASVCFGLVVYNHRALRRERLDFAAFSNHSWAFETFSIIGLCFLVAAVALAAAATFR